MTIKGNSVSAVRLFDAASSYKSSDNGNQQAKQSVVNPQVAYATQVLPGLLSNPSGNPPVASTFMG